LQLSRREATKPTRLMLGDWIEEFLSEFCETMQVPRNRISFIEEARDLEVRFDPSHLHQAVWNLCDNAIKYGEARAGISVEIKVGRLNPSNRPYLEVADRGPGIELEVVDRIFEPFFTGRSGGTGLGLFIARELCQVNRAILLYEPRGGDGSIFRIVFSDPQRWEDKD
jgi:two-component system, NtrC family, sensor histidine kinase PilS